MRRCKRPRVWVFHKHIVREERGEEPSGLEIYLCRGLPWWLRSRESTCQAGEAGSIPGSGRSPGGGKGNPLQDAAAKSLQSCPTLCDPIDSSPPGFPVPGTLQARMMEWVAISFSNAWKWKVKVKSLRPVRLLVTPWTAAYQAPPSMGLSRKEYWSGVPLPSLPLQYSGVENPMDRGAWRATVHGVTKRWTWFSD